MSYLFVDIGHMLEMLEMLDMVEMLETVEMVESRAIAASLSLAKEKHGLPSPQLFPNSLAGSRGEGWGRRATFLQTITASQTRVRVCHQNAHSTV